MTSIHKFSFRIGNTEISVITQAGVSHADGAAQERLHSHPNPEIHYLERGGVHLFTENGSTRLEEGTAVILPPKHYHAFADTEADSRRLSFELKLTRLKDGEDCYSEYEALLCRQSEPCFKRVTLNELSRAFEGGSVLSGEEEICRIRAYFTLAFIRLAELLREGHVGSHVQEHSTARLRPEDENITVMKILNYINLHYTQPLTLSGAAREVGLSERQVQRILKENMAEGFHALLTKKRVNTAKLLLKDKEEAKSLEQIAYACGFSSYVSFWSNFKRLTGTTPAEYKRSYTASGAKKSSASDI